MCRSLAEIGHPRDCHERAASLETRVKALLNDIDSDSYVAIFDNSDGDDGGDDDDYE